MYPFGGIKYMPEDAPDGPLIRQLLFLFVFILVGFIFSCAEIAVLSANQNKLERLSADGDKRAARLLKLTKFPSKFLATIQLGVTIASLLASAFAADRLASRFTIWMLSFSTPFPPSAVKNFSIIVITLALSYCSIVLGELVPKRIAMKYAERLSLMLSGPVLVVSNVFRPVVFILSASANALLRLFRIDPIETFEDVTEEEIRMMVDQGSETGAIDADEKDIIHNVFEFDNITAANVMTHRTDVILLWLEDGDAEWDKTIIEHKFTFYPICGDDQDDVVGILNSKDYFRLANKTRESLLANAVRPVQFVPESVRTDVLFRNMKKNRNHFAVVLDEYGGMSGVVTMNDLLEELVGDLEDDSDAPIDLPEIEKIGDGTWRVDGTAPLEKVAENIGVRLPVDEYDSFAAFVFGLLGTVPEDGQTPELNEYGLNVRVTEIHEHRLGSALVSVTPDGE
jgi:putative hemolysin